MKSVERLVAEHALIERVLDLLEAVTARVEAGQSVPEGFVAWAPQFFQQFADGCHHAKEEDVFFPVLKLRGIPEQGGPIGVMLHEHVLGRDCVARMREASRAHPPDLAGFAAAAREYTPLLRHHIFKENNVLFPMAERVMTSADDADVAARFCEVESDRGLGGLRESFAIDVEGWERALSNGGSR
jgi:hemerythrin-like domain-containing protein